MPSAGNTAALARGADGVGAPARDSAARRAAATRAFTLVELLLVLAILSLLLAILAPSLQMARCIATTTVCACQMNEMGNAAGAYIAGQGFFVPRDYYTPYRYIRGSGLPYPEPEAHTLVPEVLSHHLGGPDFRAIPEVDDCNDTVRDGYLACWFKDMEVLHCPAQPPSPHPAETVTNPVTGEQVVIDKQTYSYVANAFRFNGHRSCTDSAGQTHIRQLEPRGEIIYLIDGSADRPLTNFDCHDVRDVHWPGAFQDRIISDDRHGGRTPALYFDFHVETHPVDHIDAGYFSPEF